MKMNRRAMLATTTALLSPLLGPALAGCANTGGGAVPTLADVQTGLAAVIAELPATEATLLATGVLNASTKAAFDKAIEAAQAELPLLQGLTSGSSNTAIVVKTIGDALTIAAGFIPATAPFAPLIGIAITVAEAFITNKPALMGGVPVSIPTRASFHAAAVAPPRR